MSDCRFGVSPVDNPDPDPGWTTHWFRYMYRYMYNGKNRCYLAHVCQLWTCCDLENSVKSPKVTDLISIYIALYLYKK